MIDFLIWLICLQIQDIKIYEPEFQNIRVTCYTATGNHMANGEYPYEGAVAGKREDIGKYVVIRTDQDEQIMKICDCGGNIIQSGKRIDVYRNTLNGCYDWVHKYGDYQEVAILSEEQLILYQQNEEKWGNIEDLEKRKEILQMEKKKIEAWLQNLAILAKRFSNNSKCDDLMICNPFERGDNPYIQVLSVDFPKIVSALDVCIHMHTYKTGSFELFFKYDDVTFGAFFNMEKGE